MLANYFKIATRQLAKNRLHTLLNVAGLSIGLATCLVIALFVYHELSYDRFNQYADRLVRVVFRANINGGEIKEPFAMPPTAQALKNDYPEVQDATRLRTGGTVVIENAGQIFRDAKLAFVDANFLQLFTLPLVSGDAATALKDPNSVVLTRSTAQRIFGSEDPLGKTLLLKSHNATFKVTGLMEDVPETSHFQFDLFGSTAGLEEAKSTSWMQSEFYTYLLLPEDYDYRQLEAKLPLTVEKYMGPQFQQGLGMTLSEFKSKGNQIGLFLQPLTDIHLHSDFTFDLSPGGDVRYVYIFSAIALFVLLIAVINFMNLATANATRRAREVGVRKALGSARGDLVGQFLTESLLLSGVSLALALGVVALALPFFNQFTGKPLDWHLLTQPAGLAVVGGLGLLVGVLAGSYPAFFLSGFQPMAVLKNQPVAASSGRTGLRSGLVVFQFAISTALMVGAAVVYQQLNFIQHKKLGYDRDALLVLENTHLLGNREAVLRDQLLQDPRVANVTASGYKPVGPSFNNNSMVAPGEHTDQLTRLLRYGVDDRYIPTLGMKLVSGRNFSPEMASDSTAVIVNETAAKAFGWGTDAVGRQLSWANGQTTNTVLHVVGVVEDFHFKSLHEPIAPLMLVLEQSSGLVVKVKTGDVAGLLATVKGQWSSLGVEEPLKYAFLDEYFQQTYETEQKTGALVGLFAGLTIFIACLGLFGLAAFTAERRTKEIGVRKVLGASVASITQLLARDFLKLVVVAIALAVPLAGWLMQRWLSDFAYRVDLNWWTFAGAGVVAVAVALLTVSFQSVKAALANPVKSLRNE